MPSAITPWPWLGDEKATASRRTDLRRLLGPLPALGAAPSGELVSTELQPFARIERWRLALNSQEPVPALLLLPPAGKPRGLVLYNHAHGNNFAVGKEELLQGRPALQSPPFGEVLPALGFAVLAIDHWCFGERAQHGERALVKQLLWQGCTLWGYRVHDTLAAFEWLRAQPHLADLPSAALGLSMGSTMAVWAAALQPALDACLEMCGLAEFDSLLASGGHDLHGEYFFVPGLKRDFSAAEIAALIAPRMHLSLIGRDDPLTPSAGVVGIDRAMREAYSMLKHSAAWQQRTFPVAHQETPKMREMILSALRQLLAQRVAEGAGFEPAGGY
jgi:dienelactone hydrolase